MSQIKQHPLIILAKGLGTRMAISKPKTLIELSSGQTILSRLLQEACSAKTIDRIVLLVRNDSRELQKELNRSTLPIEVIVEEPQGYFRDLVAAKKKLSLSEFSVVDSDLVVPHGELTYFLSQAAKKVAWLTIGTTSFPEEQSGRPTWVDMDSNGHIRNMNRIRPLPYRTLGVFHWDESALDIRDRQITAETSIMTYIIEHLGAGHDIEGLQFSRAVNVNTKEDIVAASRLITLE